VIVDHVRVANDALYLAPGPGVTTRAVSSAIIIVGGNSPLGLKAAASSSPSPSLVRVELWRKPTVTEPAQQVAIVGQFDPNQLQMSQVDYGSWLKFTPGEDGEPPTLGATWYPGGDPANALEDSDSDGMPDGWEVRYGLNPRSASDALIDLDGDGLGNADEFYAGTNPTVADFVLHLAAIERTSTGVRVGFPSLPGRRYQLERSLALNPPDWQPVGPELEGLGTEAFATDDVVAGERQAFYRVRLLPLP